MIRAAVDAAAPSLISFVAIVFFHVQVPLARLGAGFGSALADIIQTGSLRILAERISQCRIDTRH